MLLDAYESDAVKYKRIAEKIEEHKICIFGCGLLGRNLAKYLEKYNVLQGFIDNDSKKQNDFYHGYKVVSIDDYIEENRKEIIVVAASHKNIPFIKEQLEKYNLTEGIDFFLRDDFERSILPYYVYQYKQELLVLVTQVTLTERCTLKCKKCAHGCYTVSSDSEDLPLDQVYESADMFFSFVDYVGEFVLIGGEPFLYKDLEKVIEYIGNRYRDKIFDFSITTNGTILPSDEVLKVCKKYNMVVNISDYRKENSNVGKLCDRLIKKLKQFEIDCMLSDENGVWYDYGFEYVDRNNEKEELIHVFDKCATECHEIRGSRLYYCVMARAVAENLHFNIGEDDYLDMTKVKDKEEVLKFFQGYSEKGYLDMCNRCHGSDIWKYEIPIAEQLR